MQHKYGDLDISGWERNIEELFEKLIHLSFDNLLGDKKVQCVIYNPDLFILERGSDPNHLPTLQHKISITVTISTDGGAIRSIAPVFVYDFSDSDIQELIDGKRISVLAKILETTQFKNVINEACDYIIKKIEEKSTTE